MKYSDDVNLEPIHQADISADVHECIETAFQLIAKAYPDRKYTRAVVVPSGIRLVREDGPTFLFSWAHLVNGGAGGALILQGLGDLA